MTERYTFDSFAQGESNSFAFACAKKVAEGSRAHNPIFIHGSVGLGKSHLLHAILNDQDSRKNANGWPIPGRRTRYVTAEGFMNSLVRSIQGNKMQDFREHFRDTEVLMIDDVQMLEKGERTREEFFHTFNALHDSGKQIVVTSDRPASQLAMEDRLRSRLGWGLVVDIQPPGADLRKAILYKKAQVYGYSLNESVARLLAMRDCGDVRRIEESLVRVFEMAASAGKPVTPEFAAACLADDKSSATPHSIQQRVTEHYGLKLSQLAGRTSERRTVLARHTAMWIMRQLLPLSLPEIGEVFGRDHTTVLHAIRKIEGIRRGPSLASREVGQLLESCR